MLWSNLGARITYILPPWLHLLVVCLMQTSQAGEYVTNDIRLGKINMSLYPDNGGDCAGRIDDMKAETYQQMITSPNYPDVYGNYLICRWTIATERLYEVIRFQIVDLAIRDSANCADDYIEIRDGLNSWSPAIKRYCGSNLNAVTALTSSSRTISIMFKTDGKNSDRGFKLAYWSVPKDEVMYSKPVWRASNYIALGVFFGIICFITVSIVTIAILRKLHSVKVKMRKPNPCLVQKRRPEVKPGFDANGMARDPSCDSVNTDCNTTRTSIGESTTNLANLL
ncbi:hypothetical protein LSH36_301g01023 [Paralvinella palmiformis]|uniref:CUB domain-containing protein n=1 Tax=Paralvinella palmiformis TaxID=53620 RepID=A0AAD9N357_9ANNE|nr:hypothetical protein LSH36_301g01023 [Paralvinella palmiformis]